MAPDQRRLLDTFARLVSIAIERVHFVDVAQRTSVQMESERLRNSLLAAISHDLRTPLAALSGLADSLLLTHPGAEQAEIANIMREELARIHSQVGNLLDMARLQAGSVRLRLQWQPFEEVVGSAIRSVRMALSGHVLRVELPPDLPLLEFDAVVMERVLANLIENAARYTPAGSTIVISAAIDQGRALLRVRDDGPGLPPGKEEAIFEKFERGSREGSTTGVGLGLAICRAIAQAHGGSIHARNIEGGGAEFEFSLPLGSPPGIEERAGPGDGEAPGGDGSGA
jgi:two-component system sensor histidine kinase KdpD